MAARAGVGGSGDSGGFKCVYILSTYCICIFLYCSDKMFSFHMSVQSIIYHHVQFELNTVYNKTISTSLSVSHPFVYKD